MVSTHNWYINPFEGEKEVTSLDIFPWTYVANVIQKRDTLLQRGKLFHEVTTFKYRLYKGPTLVCEPCGCTFPRSSLPQYSEEVESEVIVDFVEAIRDNSDWVPFVKGGSSTSPLPHETEDDLDVSIWNDRNQQDLNEEKEDFIFYDYLVDHAMTTEFETSDPLLRPDPDRAYNTDGGAFREEDLILLPARVLAYVFRKQYFGK